jgi:DNA-binding response OmpR family regulator
MRALNILIVDDEPTILLVLRTLLELRGHTVLTAERSDAARVIAGEHSLDVALIDKRLPGGGLQLAQELAARAPLAGRVVLMSGDGAATEESLGGLPLIGKPFDYDQVVARLEQVGTNA